MESSKRIKELFTDLQSAHLASVKLIPDDAAYKQASKHTLDLIDRIEAKVCTICAELEEYGYPFAASYTVYLLGMKGKPLTLVPEC